jgi:hypothetical protein
MNVWKGVFRIWVAASVAWGIYDFWRSDPNCVFALMKISNTAGPWCDYRGWSYYSQLLVEIFGWPLLAGILLLAAQWISRGFKNPKISN